MKANTQIMKKTTAQKMRTMLKEAITEKSNLEIKHQTIWKGIKELEEEQKQLETKINKTIKIIILPTLKK